MNCLSQLLQLSSPMLPVGAYCYSQGLEWAIEVEEVSDLASAQRWIQDVLTLSMAQFELPLLLRLYQAWESQDLDSVSLWNQRFLAGRDSSEALAETKQMGYSLARLLKELESLPLSFIAQLQQLQTVSFPAAYAGAAYIWQIPAREMLHGYAWSWLENQVSVAMKAVPLGQVAGQKILLQSGAQLPDLIQSVMALPDDELSNFSPALSLCSCLHETQYTRLFRS